jgi:hypothetical protein
VERIRTWAIAAPGGEHIAQQSAQELLEVVREAWYYPDAVCVNEDGRVYRFATGAGAATKTSSAH